MSKRVMHRFNVSPHLSMVLIPALLAVPLLFLQCAIAPPTAETEPAVETATFEWNVFLRPWHIIGPFPKEDDGERGLKTDYLGGELVADPQAQPEVVYKDQTYRWEQYDRQVVDFDTAYDPETDNDDLVAYAWTKIQSSQDQDAVLAIGSDDGFRAWFNGEQILEYIGPRGSYLDDNKATVKLREGENVLLIKVEDTMQDWGAFARLFPSELEKPLLSFSWTGDRPWGIGHLPDLTIEYLDTGGQVQATHHTSGFRERSSRQFFYLFYQSTPEPPPAQLRVSFESPGYKTFEKTVTWEEALAGPVEIEAQGQVTLSGRVVEEESGRPIPNARLALVTRVLPERTDELGKFQLENLEPAVGEIVVYAEGYLNKVQPLQLPAPAPIEIKMTAGGKILKGQVTDNEGKPVAGAHLRLSMRDPESRDITDERGRFALSGIAEDRTSVFPVIEHPDFVPLTTFSEELGESKVKEVTYTMQPGAVVTGKVTAIADGRPLPGVRVVTGSDRFGSNAANPETTADGEGRFRLTSVSPGSALVHAFSEEFAPAMQTVMTDVGKEAEVNFELEPGKDATGQVTDPEGNPVASVRLVTDTWSGARMFRRESRTDKEGKFTLSHMPSTPAEVHVLRQGYVSKRDLNVVGGEHYEVTLKPVPKHIVTVSLKDAEQLPENVEIHRGYLWQGRDDVFWEKGRIYDAEWDAETATLTIEPSEAGNYKLLYRFRVPGYQDGIFEVPEEAPRGQTHQLVLEPATQLKGRVVSARTGEPLEGIIIAVVSKEERLRLDSYVDFEHLWRPLERFAGVQTTSAADGSFELSDLESRPDSDLVLLKEQEGFAYIKGAGSLVVDGVLELPFPEAGAVKGQVIDAGEPVADEKVTIRWKPPVEQEWNFPLGFGGQLPTDEEGRYEFIGLGPGNYTLYRVRSFGSGSGSISMYLKRHDITVLPGEELSYNLVRPAGYELKGRTLDKEGNPLPQCIVRVYETAQGRRDTVEVVRSNGEGKFTIAHVPEGKFTLEAEHYTRCTAASCGLGDVDARGRKMLTVAADTTIEIKLNPSLGGMGRPDAPSLAGSIPADFTAKPLNSETTFTLSQQLGKVVALDFWATWCGPCMAVMPQMKKLWEKYRDSDEVIFITISLDSSEKALHKIMKEKEIEFPVIFSGKGWNDTIGRSFGVRAIPSSFVIGKNGRFASDRIHGAQLAQAIEKALAMPPDPAFAEGAKPARLDIEVSLEQDGGGVPGAELELKAINADSSVAKEEKVTMPGQASKITWLYPQLKSGGSVSVTVKAPGLESQTKKLKDPEASATVAFQFKSPRQVSGRLSVDEGEVPAADLQVIARRDDGFARSATSDAKGRFTIPVLPGSYYVMVEGNEQFAAPSDPLMVEVLEDKDPPEETIAMSRALTIHGRVLDAEGQPVAEAEVYRAGFREPIMTDEEGRFELPGVAATVYSMVYATKDKMFGRLELDSASTEQEYELTLGERRGGGRAERLSAGAKAPELTVRPLAGGEETLWQPAKDARTLVVFCALWHPEGRKLLLDAAQRAEEEKLQLAAFSIDWYPDQALRQLQTMPAAPPVLYAGPGGLHAAKEWKLSEVAQAFLLSPEGKVLKNPAPGELP